MRLWSPLLLSLLATGCSEPERQNSEWTPITIDSTIAKQLSAEEMIEPYRKLMEAEMNRVLVISDTIIYKVSPESPLGNLIADLSYERAVKESANRSIAAPNLCLLNFGGLRVNLPNGEIMVRKVFELMPFENELVVIELTPDSLTSLVNYVGKVGGQPISHMKLGFDSNGPAETILIEGKEIDSTRNYRVITTDYLANGGDHMHFFKNPVSRTELGVKLRDAIIEHFLEIGNAGASLNPEIDGRLIIKE